jgi:inactivated superfamily I helicase
MLSRMTATQTKWAERVQAWRASGKTADEYASVFEFQASTLRYWASRLKTEAAKKPAAIVRVVRRAAREVAAEPVGADVQSEVEVAVGGARILVRPGFDPEFLRQVAAALGRAR